MTSYPHSPEAQNTAMTTSTEPNNPRGVDVAEIQREHDIEAGSDSFAFECGRSLKYRLAHQHRAGLLSLFSRPEASGGGDKAALVETISRVFFAPGHVPTADLPGTLADALLSAGWRKSTGPELSAKAKP